MMVKFKRRLRTKEKNIEILKLSVAFWKIIFGNDFSFRPAKEKKVCLGPKIHVHVAK